MVQEENIEVFLNKHHDALKSVSTMRYAFNFPCRAGTILANTPCSSTPQHCTSMHWLGRRYST